MQNKMLLLEIKWQVEIYQANIQIIIMYDHYYHVNTVIHLC